MRKIIYAGFVSLDGVMQAPGGPTEDPTGGFKFGGWTVPYGDEAVGGFVGGLFGGDFDLLLGRKTYEIFAAHWPFVGADDPIGQAFDKATKYVASWSGVALTWQNSVSLNGDAAASVAKLKDGEGPDLHVWGSGDFMQTLLEHDLVDELRIMTYPLVLGGGKKLFGPGVRPAALKLTSSGVSTTGVVMSVYERAGEVRTGSYAQDAPSELELARRERMARAV